MASGGVKDFSGERVVLCERLDCGWEIWSDMGYGCVITYFPQGEVFS